MDWFPAMVALMVADLAWPHQAKIVSSPNFGGRRHFVGKRIYRLKAASIRNFSLEDEQKPRSKVALLLVWFTRCTVDTSTHCLRSDVTR